MDAGVHARLMALAGLATRDQAAQAVARVLGCDQLVLLVRDATLGVLLPAPGMPKTLPGGPQWRSFLQRCSSSDGRHQAEVDLPVQSPRPALAIARDGVVALLLGGAPDESAVAVLEAELPLLGALLKAEQQWGQGQAEAADARAAAERAHTLVKALDAARAAAAVLNEQLRGEHSRKDEFLAMLAHELRNPLAPLMNSLGILRRVPDRNEKVASRQLDIMGRQVDQLSRLVEDLLDVSRVSRGLIRLRRERLLLADVLDAAVEAVRPAMEARQHQLETFGEHQPLYINGDRVRLTQVFANLLQNAVKYTDEGGILRLGIVADSGRASVIVRDSGVGISPDMLTHIFDLFAQLPVSLDRAQGGLGIGLTLVRTLVELHGGHVTAHSVGIGHGSTFTVTLPLVLAPTPAPVPAPAAARLPPGALSAPGVRVLVVDDNADAADSLAAMVSLMGAQPRVARDGHEAIGAAYSFSPEVVFLDIGLPGMDGYETAQRLRQLAGPRMRLVALTGYDRAEDRERSSRAGFDAHLVKPASPEAIEQILHGFALTATTVAS